MIRELLRHATEKREGPRPTERPRTAPRPFPDYELSLESIDGNGYRQCPVIDCRYEARWTVQLLTPDLIDVDRRIRCDIHAILDVQAAMKARR